MVISSLACPPPLVSMTAATGHGWGGVSRGGGRAAAAAYRDCCQVRDCLPLRWEGGVPGASWHKKRSLPMSVRHPPRAELSDGIPRACGSSQRSVLGPQVSGSLIPGALWFE